MPPFYTDDFESDTAGSQPTGWDNFIAYNYKTTNPQGDGTGALADSTHTHNGSKLAVHFKASGSNPVFLERALPAGTNHLYVRAYFYLANQLGMQPSSGGDNHETLLGITADPTNVNTEVRFGQIKGVIGTNQVPSDNIAPVMAQWYSGPVISSASWHCIQVEFADLRESLRMDPGDREPRRQPQLHAHPRELRRRLRDRNPLRHVHALRRRLDRVSARGREPSALTPQRGPRPRDARQRALPPAPARPPSRGRTEAC